MPVIDRGPPVTKIVLGYGFAGPIPIRTSPPEFVYVWPLATPAAVATVHIANDRPTERPTKRPNNERSERIRKPPVRPLQQQHAISTSEFAPHLPSPLQARTRQIVISNRRTPQTSSTQVLNPAPTTTPRPGRDKRESHSPRTSIHTPPHALMPGALMPNALMPTRFSPPASLQRCLPTNAESRMPNAATHQ